MKLLGFHFDERPTVDAHVAAILKKVRYRTWAIHNLKRLGLSSSGLMVVYKSLVRPCFDYSCVVYHSLLSKSLSESLEKQQRKILKIIFGYDVSYARALALSGIERLDGRRCQLRERFVIKMSNNDRIAEWLPLAGTPAYPLRCAPKYVELPFRAERLRAAPLYSYRRVLNALQDENDN